MSLCTIINAHITDQVLQLSNLPRIASGSKEALQIRCNFCGKWEGCGKVAVFYRDDVKDEDGKVKSYHVPIVDNLVTVPWEMLVDEGYFWLGFMGQDDLTRTTEVIRVEVAKGALTVATATPQDPTPDIYQLIMKGQGELEARFNAAIAVPGSFDPSAVFENESADGRIKVKIYSNGFAAFAAFTIGDMTDVLSKENPLYESQGVIPEELKPIAPAAFHLEFSGIVERYRVMLSPSKYDGFGYQVAVQLIGGYEPTTSEWYSGVYVLANPSLPELTDIRSGKYGEYDTAGKAVRQEIAYVEQTTEEHTDELYKLNTAVDAHGHRIEELEKVGKLDVHEVEGYAFAFCDEDGNVALAITNEGEVKHIGSGIGSTFDYTKCGLPVLYLEGDTTKMTKETEAALKYKFCYTTTRGLAEQVGNCTCKWQGSSSVSRGYPKRNYTLKFSAPFEATDIWGQDDERVVNFAKPWGAQKKYCAKANWIDPSGARNVVSARLWAAIVADRAERYGTVPEKLLSAPNNGAIDGFPVIIVINDEFTGLYTFNIPKDDWTFNMGDGEAEYVVGCESNSHNHASCRWSGPASFEDEVDYAIEVKPDGVDDSVVVNSFNTAIDAMVNATQSSQWETDVAPYFDVDAAIDYMIFACCIGGRDNRRKNILYGTYDGVKWFMSAYDLDTTFGANVHNKGWYPVINDANQFYEMSTWHRVFSYIYKYSKGRLKARYKELRSTILSDENVWYMLNNFVSDIPLVVYNMDAERWSDKRDNAPGRKTAMQGTATANVNNYMHYYRMHCAYLDKEIEAL